MIIILATNCVAQVPRRPMVADDLFSLQTLGDVRISPDGELIAVVIQRAFSDPETFRPYGMFGNDHADIWILSAAVGRRENITQGAREGSGYWDPVWSPDRDTKLNTVIFPISTSF